MPVSLSGSYLSDSHTLAVFEPLRTSSVCVLPKQPLWTCMISEGNALQSVNVWSKPLDNLDYSQRFSFCHSVVTSVFVRTRDSKDQTLDFIGFLGQYCSERGITSIGINSEWDFNVRECQNIASNNLFFSV